MDNNNLKGVVKKLERDILTLEVDRATESKVEQPRSNSVQLRFKRQVIPPDKSKKHFLNPFLRVQVKLEVLSNHQDFVKKSNIIIGGINKLPETEKNIINVLSKELKSFETENKLLKEEVDVLKRRIEASEFESIILEKKLAIISNYFKDALQEVEEDDLLHKRYKILLGILASSNPSGSVELSGMFHRDHSISKADVSHSSSNQSGQFTNEGFRRPNMQLDLQTIDTSNRSSSNLNISTDGRRKRERILKHTKKMKQKCDAFLQRLEEVEEAERLLKLKGIEDSRKQQTNLVREKGHLLAPGNETANIKNVILAITERMPRLDVKEEKPSPQEKEKIPTPTPTHHQKAGASGHRLPCTL